MLVSVSMRDHSSSRIDLRSDTVTQPTMAMRDAMATAEVGDDVYGDDTTVNALQERTAQLLGKEAGLFVASGTQSNLVALLSHCQRGDELLVGDCFHIHRYEAGGVSVLGGVMMSVLETDHRGVMRTSDITAAIKPDDLHCPISRLLCLENTVHGHVHDRKTIVEPLTYLSPRGMRMCISCACATRRRWAISGGGGDTGNFSVLLTKECDV